MQTKHPFCPRLLALGFSLVTAAPSVSLADWRDEIGYTRLAAQLGAQTPTGIGVGISHVEASASLDYTPLPGSGTVVATGKFANISFDFKSGPSQGGYHANEVGSQIYGRLGFGGRDGLAYGLAKVDLYETNLWVESGFLNVGVSPPDVETNAVANHSWAAPTEGNDPLFNGILHALDFSVDRDDYVCVVGGENSGTLPPTLLLMSAYNVLSVGLTSGNHAHGLTLNNVDGTGRVKPELVAPMDYTSYSTAVVTACASLLQGEATVLGGNATHQQTIRAVLLAGATKAEFPNWTRTTVHPLDLTYGAGQVNIYNSHLIINGGEQTPSATVPVASQGWDYGTTNNLRDYLLEVPPAMAGAKLSAVVCWNRTLQTAQGQSFDYAPRILANFNLTLDKKVNSTYTAVDSSDSAVDNVEHIYRPSLPSGTYRLRVSKPNNTAYAVAWQLQPPAAPPVIAITSRPGGYDITAENLVPGQLYSLQSSVALTGWTTLQTFTATTTSRLVLSTPIGADMKRFFRLAW